VHQNFRIGLRCESMSEQCQAFPEFAVVIKLAVVDDSDIPRFVPDWLPASSQVNDAEPAHAQGQPRSPRLSGKESFFIWPAMPHGRCHSTHAQFSILAARRKRDTANAAHATV
jgi:hypothetical protein